MKTTTTLIAAYLASASLAAQAGGIVFKTPVTYTESVTYAAGVTYLAPVTYSSTKPTAVIEPVMLERIVVTPSRVYAEHEWQAHLNTRRSATPFWTANAERRFDVASRSWLRSLLTLQ